MKLVLVWICFWGLSTTLSVPASSLDWHDAGGFRWADLAVPTVGRAGFQRMTPEQTGLSFTNTLGEWEGAANRVLFNGSGVALGDFDRDGLPDIFICGMDTPNALYRNLGGWKFENVTRESGLNFTGRFYRGAVFADLNGDNWLDLLVSTTGQGVLCFLNDGHGRFRDVSAAAGTVEPARQRHAGPGRHRWQRHPGSLHRQQPGRRHPRSRQGRYLHVTRPTTTSSHRHWPTAWSPVQGRVLEYGEPDQLLLNDGNGVFTEVSWTQGAFLDEDGQPLATVPMDWTLTVTFRDVNDDGAPDIYLCNDYWSPDRLWINDGKGRFRAIDRLAIRHTSASSMGVDFADIDRDGHLDFFVLDMLSRDARLRKRQMLAQTPMTATRGRDRRSAADHAQHAVS